MPEIEFRWGAQIRTVSATERETILDCALRNGIAAPYSCLEGVCNSCLAKVCLGEAKAEEVLTCQELIKSDDPPRFVDYNL